MERDGIQPTLNMLNIRDFNEQDRSAIESCIIDFQEYERALQPDRLPGTQIASSYLTYLLDQYRNNEGRFLIAELDSQIVGYACIWVEKIANNYTNVPSHVRLCDIYVSSQCRGKGIGKILLAEVENFAKEKGQNLILLNVLANNPDTIALYHKMGYLDYELIMTKDVK